MATLSPRLPIATGRRYDLISLGEVMLRLAPPRFKRLRTTRSLDVEVAGAQLNVAANLAQWGKRTAFVTKLPENELGLLARDTCTGYGVDMSHVLMSAEDRMGINFLEFSAAPRAEVAVFDREGSAASRLGPDDFDWDDLLAQASLAHTDGIFPGIGPRTAEATENFIRSAKAQGCITSFDVNYREHVWSPERARSCWQELLPHIDIVVTSPGVSELVFGFKGTDEEVAQSYADAFGCRLVVVTRRESPGLSRGAWSSLARQEGQTITGKRFEFDSIDRYGTGDAFMAGLLHGLLEGDAATALDFGNAACALSHTIEGDIARLGADEVRRIMGDNIDLRVRR